MIAALAVFDRFTALDLIGPYQVLSVMPDTDVVLCAERPGVIFDDNGLLHLDIKHTFTEVTDPDIILVPGGPGARTQAREDSPLVEWIKQVHPAATWTTSVCTGSLILGAAGLLKNRTATTHWCFYEELARHGAIPVEQRVVFHDQVATAAGVSSGIDLALELAARVTNPYLAQAIQLGIEYDPQPPFDSGAPSKAIPELKELVYSLMRPTVAGPADATNSRHATNDANVSGE